MRARRQPDSRAYAGPELFTRNLLQPAVRQPGRRHSPSGWGMILRGSGTRTSATQTPVVTCPERAKISTGSWPSWPAPGRQRRASIDAEATRPIAVPVGCQARGFPPTGGPRERAPGKPSKHGTPRRTPLTLECAAVAFSGRVGGSSPVFRFPGGWVGDVSLLASSSPGGGGGPRPHPLTSSPAHLLGGRGAGVAPPCVGCRLSFG